LALVLYTKRELAEDGMGSKQQRGRQVTGSTGAMRDLQAKAKKAEPMSVKGAVLLCLRQAPCKPLCKSIDIRIRNSFHV
jgi:hypothetical protein